MTGIVAPAPLRHHPGKHPMRSSTMPSIVRLPGQIPHAPRRPVDSDRLVAGAPCQAIDNGYASADQAFQCGIWEGDVGAYGTMTELAAGDSFVIPAGFAGVWEVIEPARKLYAVYEP
jgi:uncharacterized cupin superfamily protein